MAKIRTLIVEDSLTVRSYLSEILSADPDIDLVGVAEDGKRAIELCQALRPDVITMDMMLPVMTGCPAFNALPRLPRCPASHETT